MICFDQQDIAAFAICVARHGLNAGHLDPTAIPLDGPAHLVQGINVLSPLSVVAYQIQPFKRQFGGGPAVTVHSGRVPDGIYCTFW